MRITALAHEAGLLADDDMFVQEARAALASGDQPKAEQRVADLRIALNAGEYDGDIPIEFFESALEKI